jgi:hypothetical protein
MTNHYAPLLSLLSALLLGSAVVARMHSTPYGVGLLQQGHDEQIILGKRTDSSLPQSQSSLGLIIANLCISQDMVFFSAYSSKPETEVAPSIFYVRE